MWWWSDKIYILLLSFEFHLKLFCSHLSFSNFLFLFFFFFFHFWFFNYSLVKNRMNTKTMGTQTKPRQQCCMLNVVRMRSVTNVVFLWSKKDFICISLIWLILIVSQDDSLKPTTTHWNFPNWANTDHLNPHRSNTTHSHLPWNTTARYETPWPTTPKGNTPQYVENNSVWFWLVMVGSKCS